MLLRPPRRRQQTHHPGCQSDSSHHARNLFNRLNPTNPINPFTLVRQRVSLIRSFFASKKSTSLRRYAVTPMPMAAIAR